MADRLSGFRDAAVRLALRLWRTDLTFWQYPFGPPSYGIRYGLAWWLYHWGIRSEHR